ncbi:hypothetical protein C8R47DRAFT_1069851 [Mycena vitilis]|nr:hypothetical protein C8R47DRAFT_1069851 [Mycena vitilis]
MKFDLTVIFSAFGVAVGSALSTHASMPRSSETCGDPSLTVPFYRIYSSSGIDHEYTTFVGNVNHDVLVDGSLLQTVAALVFVTQGTSTVPFYRLFSTADTDHFYTVSTTERDAAVKNGYVVQDEPLYIYPTQICGSLPLFRLFSSAAQDNFYTVSESERLDFIENQGYADVEIAGYVFPVTPNPCN